MSVPGVILAGGLSRRMGGGDKTLLALDGRPILDHVIDRLRPQTTALAINANGDPARFARFDLPILPDTVDGHPGPLAGVLAAMRFAAKKGGDAVLTAPADTPFLPRDLARRLGEARPADGIAMASGAGRTHPVCALWPVSLADTLERTLRDEDERRIIRFAERHGLAIVPFDDDDDPFFNVNTPDDLATAQARFDHV